MQRRGFLMAAPLALLGHAWAAEGGVQLSGRTVEDQPYSLAQDAGKVVLVFFWSTACAVCRDKLPELRRNHLGWRGKGFQVVGVSLDQSLDDVRNYVRLVDQLVPTEQRFPMLWRAHAQHRDSFGAVTRTPTSFVLDRGGRLAKVVAGRMDAALWDDIAELVLL